MIENVLAYGEKHIQRVVPSGLIELSFYFGDKPQVVENQKSVLDHAVITGQLNGYHDLLVTGQLSLFSIASYPHGLADFIEMPIIELNNSTVPLNDVLKQFSSQLVDELDNAETFEKRIQIIEQFLLGCLARNRPSYNHERMQHCIKLINQKKGRVDIDELSAEACLSRKQFERVFSNYVGASPKQFLKTIRFQNAICQQSFANNSLAQVACECGYYDQSHMNRDFAILAGMSPKNYMKVGEPFSDYFQ